MSKEQNGEEKPMDTELEKMTRVEIEDKIKRRQPRDLGYANGWGDTPEIVKNCPHRRYELPLGSCVTQVSCPICGFTYRVDSSDCGS